MTQILGIDVRYKGNDDPFFDRLYRSGLTFAPGQSRNVPPQLAERFLRHSDVFERVKTAAELLAEAEALQKDAEKAQADADALALKQKEEALEKKRRDDAEALEKANALVRDSQARALNATSIAQAAAQVAADAASAGKAPAEVKDDTLELLEAGKKKDEEQRVKDEARFNLMDQLDTMDRTALLSYAQDKFQQKLPANIGEAKLRERVKGFVDTYGVP